MSALRFALRDLWRDWRSGDLRLLAIALILAVAAVTSVGFFTDRVNQALRQQANELLAADLAVESSNPLPPTLSERATQQGLQTSSSLSFPSVVMGVVMGDDTPQLVQVKAVGNGYPLRGRMLVQNDLASAPRAAPNIPPAGEIWVEPRLLALLNARPGDSLSLGEQRFRIGALIALEPDRGGDLFQVAPRVMLNLADVPATGLINEASRVSYRFMAAGERESVEAFRGWARKRLPSGARLLDTDDARPELRAALDRGRLFLALAALVAVLVTGAAVALATRKLVERQADAIAIMRCLGAQRGFLRTTLMLRLLGLVVIAGIVGALLGYLAQYALAALVGRWFSTTLPAAGLSPLLTGFATAALCLAGFALAALVRLPDVPPLRVLRRDLGPTPASPWAVGLSALGALALMLIWQAGDAALAIKVLLATTAVVTALAAVGYGVIWLAARLQRHARGMSRFALASLSRHPVTTLLQMGGFGLGIMALLLLAVVRVDLLSAWERTLPEDAPNRFLINILPDQVEGVRQFFAEHGLSGSGLHPMVRARLIRIGDHEVHAEDYGNPRAQRLASREFNLSWADHPQADNRIVLGRWWSDVHAPAQFSVEQGIAETLGIRLGDQLTYNLAGREISAPVTSLRSVRWDSFNVNFFVVSNPDLLENEAATYVTSFHLPAGQETLAADLIRAFPSATLLDVSAVMGHVRGVIARGSRAVEYVFLFTLAAGVLVLVAGIQAGAETRRREAAILRTLGVQRNQLLTTAALEFGTLGLITGLIATTGAALTGTWLAEQVFGLDYGFSPWLWFTGVGGAALGIALAGVMALWPLVLRPPLASLRAGH